MKPGVSDSKLRVLNLKWFCRVRGRSRLRCCVFVCSVWLEALPTRLDKRVCVQGVQVQSLLSAFVASSDVSSLGSCPRFRKKFRGEASAVFPMCFRNLTHEYTLRLHSSSFLGFILRIL